MNYLYSSNFDRSRYTDRRSGPLGELTSSNDLRTCSFGRPRRLYILWHCRKQRSVAASTTEAEYVGTSGRAKTVKWAIEWMKGARFRAMNSDRMKLPGDDQDAIKFTKNPDFLERIKHIDVRCHCIRQLIEDDDGNDNEGNELILY